MCGAVHGDETNGPNFAGSLRWAVDEEGAELLGLSDETRKKLAELVAQRDVDGKRLLATPELSEDDKKQLLNDFVREGERLGRELLSLDQREGLVQLLLAREGMVTLARSDVAQILALTESQRDKIASVLKARQKAIDKLSGLRREIAIRSYERRLQTRLTAEQLVKWQKMAGLGEPAAGEEEQPQPVPHANSQPIAEAHTPAADVAQVRLRFAFERTPWRTVIDWLAEEANLSVYVSTMPPGTLTYTDAHEFTPDQVIERINRVLIPDGFTLIRSGKMISVIGLDDGRRDQLLDALAEYTSLIDLDQRGDYEVVKCVFTLAKADPQEALAEIAGLIKLSTPLLMPKSKQILVIESAAKLRMVRDVLQAMENPSIDGGPVRRFELKHIRAGEVFAALRPLVGIDDELSNIGPDISLAANANGKEIFAKGSAQNLAVVEGVVQMLDKSSEERDGVAAPTLRAHSTNGANLQTVDDVLQTLLAGENVRLAQDATSGRLIALASEEIHKQIEETIAQLEGEVPVFEALQLQRVEPYVAISVIREMFDIPFFTDDEDEDKDHPRLDWDTPSMRIFVRGKQSQVDEIKKIVERLEQPREPTKGPLRLLPLHGERAQRLLETGKRFWPGADEVLVFPPDTVESPNDVLERVINDDDEPAAPAEQAPSPAPKRQESDRSPSPHVSQVTFTETKLVGEDQSEDSSGAAGTADGQSAKVIKAQVTPRGILMHSDDIDLLNRFEKHLRTIAGPGEFSATRMAIFYLKHLPAADAKSMLSDIRRGQSSSGRDRSRDELDSEDDSTGSSRPGRSYYSYSAPSIIADPRLNRLIVQGTAEEIVQIERHLRIIDRDKSLADVETRGKARVIQLVHIRAATAAKIIQETYQGQIASGSSGDQQQAQQQQQLKIAQAQLQQLQVPQQQQQPQSQQQPGQQPQRGERAPGAGRNSQTQQQGAPAESDRRDDQPNSPAPSSETASQSQQSRTREPQMSLSVEESSNSLIIRAPDQLFEEISELVQLIDQKATQTTEVIKIRGASNESIRQALERAVGKLRSGDPPPKPTQPAPQPAQQPVQLQIKM